MLLNERVFALRARLLDLVVDCHKLAAEFVEAEGGSGNMKIIGHGQATVAPAWRNRPTCPGIWVCVQEEHNGKPTKSCVLALTQDNLNHSTLLFTTRVFGPIPEIVV